MKAKCPHCGKEAWEIQINPISQSHQRLRWLGHKAVHLTITFVLGVAIATVFHLIVTNHQIRRTAEAVCNVFGRDANECKSNIDNVFDMADTEVENNININGGDR